jgi:hypothetical protein
MEKRNGGFADERRALPGQAAAVTFIGNLSPRFYRARGIPFNNQLRSFHNC